MIPTHHSAKFIGLVKLCIVVTFLNASSLLQAAVATEVNRPEFAEGNLSVTVNEDVEGSNSEYQSYIINFKNLDDYELAYQDLSIKFPELDAEPELLSGAEADRLVETEPTRRSYGAARPTPVIYNSYYFPHSHHTHRHHSSRSGSVGCGETCAVLGVILIVVVVVGVIGLIASSGKKSRDAANAKAKAKAEAEALTAEDQNPKAPIRLLRFQEKARKITVRKGDIKGLKSIVIELVDKNDKRRTFEALLPGRAAM
jgi:hypothetical protein